MDDNVSLSGPLSSVEIYSSYMNKVSISSITAQCVIMTMHGSAWIIDISSHDRFSQVHQSRSCAIPFLEFVKTTKRIR